MEQSKDEKLDLSNKLNNLILNINYLELNSNIDQN